MPELTNEQYNKASPYFANLWQDLEGIRSAFFSLFDQLPEKLKEFLVGNESAQKLWDTGKKYSLSDDQIESMSRTVRGFVTGEILVGGLISSFRDQLGIAPTIADNLANELLQGMLAPLLPDIQKIQQTRPLNPAVPPKIRPAPNLYAAPTPASIPTFQPVQNRQVPPPMPSRPVQQSSPPSPAPSRPASVPMSSAPTPVPSPQPASGPKPWAMPPRPQPSQPTGAPQSFAATEQDDSVDTPTAEVPPANVINLRNQ